MSTYAFPAIADLLMSAPKLKALTFPGVKISRSASDPTKFWVTDGAPFGESTFFGTLTSDGVYHPSRKSEDSIYWGVTELLESLKTPEDIARIGRESGVCCYCGRTLTDGASVHYGYGPVCAKYHHLPYDKKVAA